DTLELTEEQRAAEQKKLDVQQARAAELQRLDDIQALGKRFKMEARADLCALEGKTVEETRSVLLAELKKQQDDTVTNGQNRADPGAGKDHPIITIHQSVRSFSGARDEAAKKAFRFANWFIAANLTDVRALSGNATVARAVKYCKDYGINIV